MQDKRIKNARITPELIHIPEWDLGEEDLMHIEIVPELPPSGDSENNIRAAIDVFSRYAFAYPVFNPTAVSTAKVNIDTTTRHVNLRTLFMTGKGRVFVSHVKHEEAETLGILLKHATTHAQTFGVLGWPHVNIRTALKLASGEYRKQWHNYLPIAILNYNTTYHFSNICEPSRVFHGIFLITS